LAVFTAKSVLARPYESELSSFSDSLIREWSVDGRRAGPSADHLRIRESEDELSSVLAVRASTVRRPTRPPNLRPTRGHRLPN